MASRRVWLLRITLMASAVVVALVIGELLLAMYAAPGKQAPTRRNAPPNQAARSAYQKAPWIAEFGDDTLDMHAVVQPFAWEPATAAAANSWGFRTPEFTLARPPSTFRVVVLGDSIAWGQGVPFEASFPEVLERELAPAMRDVGLEVEVIALAVCGSRLVDSVIRLAVLGERLAPDLLVVQYFPNDLQIRETVRRADLLAQLGRHSNLVEAVRMVRDRDVFWDRLEEWTDPASREWRVFTSAAGELGAWRKRTGVPVAVVAFPPSDLRPHGGNFDEFRGLEEFRPILDPPLRALEEAGLEVLDLVPDLKREAGREYLCVSERDGHPNAFGHGIAARALARMFEDRGWLPESRAGVARGGPTYSLEWDLRADAASRWSEYNADYAPQRELVDELGALYPDEPWIVAQSAALDQEMGRYEGACDGWRRLADLAPERSAPWYHRARCVPDDEQRTRELERMLAVVPDHAPSIEGLMQVAERAGRIEDLCGRAVELGRTARYPDQLARAYEAFEAHRCSGRGHHFWR